jgi:hypothetical protein
MKYFTNCKTLDELKKEYRRLAMLHHPDRGGDTQTMKEINGQYDEAFEALKHQHNATADESHKKTEMSSEYKDIIDKLIHMAGVTVELCGSWLWIGGNTREHKEELKAAGCRWSANKKLWYWHHAEEGAKWHRGKSTMSEIRSKYGSQTFAGATESSNYSRLNEAV